MTKLNLIQQVDGEYGYSTDVKLSSAELEMLRQMIRLQWLYRIQLLVPKEANQFDQFGIEHYHEINHAFDHSQVWPKTARVLPREAVNLIRNMNFFKEIEQSIGRFDISDEEHLGWENIYWRIVRPGKCDIGSPHADKWFWEIGGYGKVAEFPHRRLKIWIAIHTVPGKSGLMLSVGSHRKKDWKWHAEVRYDLNKPVIDEPLENLNLQLMPLSAGETIIFHDDLIHCGSPNTSETTRTSLEFTLLVPTQITSRSTKGNLEFA